MQLYTTIFQIIDRFFTCGQLSEKYFKNNRLLYNKLLTLAKRGSVIGNFWIHNFYNSSHERNEKKKQLKSSIFTYKNQVNKSVIKKENELLSEQLHVDGSL